MRFRDRVTWYIAFCGVPIALAAKFEVAVSTVHRWASGEVRPPVRLQKQIMDWIDRVTFSGP